MRKPKSIEGNFYGVWKAISRDANNPTLVNCTCKECGHNKTFRYSNLTQSPSACPVCKANTDKASYVANKSMYCIVIEGKPTTWHPSSALQAMQLVPVGTLAEAAARNSLTIWRTSSNGTMARCGTKASEAAFAFLDHITKGTVATALPDPATAPDDASHEASVAAQQENNPLYWEKFGPTTTPSTPTIEPDYQPLRDPHIRIRKEDMPFLTDAVNDRPVPPYLLALVEPIPNLMDLEWDFSPAGPSEVFAYWTNPNKATAYIPPPTLD